MRLFILLFLVLSVICAPLNATEKAKETGVFGIVKSFITDKLENLGDELGKVLEIDQMLETPEGREELVDKTFTEIENAISSLEKY